MKKEPEPTPGTSVFLIHKQNTTSIFSPVSCHCKYNRQILNKCYWCNGTKQRNILTGYSTKFKVEKDPITIHTIVTRVSENKKSRGYILIEEVDITSREISYREYPIECVFLTRLDAVTACRELNRINEQKGKSK